MHVVLWAMYVWWLHSFTDLARFLHNATKRALIFLSIINIHLISIFLSNICRFINLATNTYSQIQIVSSGLTITFSIIIYVTFCIHFVTYYINFKMKSISSHIDKGCINFISNFHTYIIYLFKKSISLKWHWPEIFKRTKTTINNKSGAIKNPFKNIISPISLLIEKMHFSPKLINLNLYT